MQEGEIVHIHTVTWLWYIDCFEQVFQYNADWNRRVLSIKGGQVRKHELSHIKVMMVLYQQEGQGLVDDRGKDVSLLAEMT